MFYLTHVRKDRDAIQRNAEGKKLDPETLELQIVSDLVTLAVKQSSLLEEYVRHSSGDENC